jgi:hypothetical protein
MSRVYLAGPMGGLPGWNFPAFDDAAKYLRAMGHDVVNPADLDRDQGYVAGTEVTLAMRQEALRRDFYELVTCDRIALLAGWDASTGATAERRVAEDCGIEVWHVDPWKSFSQEPRTILVGLSGYAQSGKDTVGQIMAEMAQFERIAFADALKAVTLDCNPGVRSAVQSGGWENVKKQHPTARIFLQHLGVAVREHVSADAWVDAAMRKVTPGGRYVFTDVRFPSEADAITAAGGYVVRVERTGTGPVNQHASETALDGYDGWSAILRNTGTLEDLRSKVRTMLSTI